MNLNGHKHGALILVHDAVRGHVPVLEPRRRGEEIPRVRQAIRADWTF